MAVTRSTAATRKTSARASSGIPLFGRIRDLLWTALACGFVAFALHLVWQAKAPALIAGQTLNLNALSAREELLPSLQSIQDPAEREFVARKIYYAAGSLPNVGAIARLRVDADEIGCERGLQRFRARLGDRKSLPLLTPEQFRLLKPLFFVRAPGSVTRDFHLYAAAFFAIFILVHYWWAFRRFTGDET